MHNKNFHQGNKWSELAGRDLDNKNSFDFDQSNLMAARNKNLILVLSNNDIVRSTKTHPEAHFLELETSLNNRSLLEEPLLLTTTINILDVASIS